MVGGMYVTMYVYKLSIILSLVPSIECRYTCNPTVPNPYQLHVEILPDQLQQLFLEHLL